MLLIFGLLALVKQSLGADPKPAPADLVKPSPGVPLSVEQVREREDRSVKEITRYIRFTAIRKAD
jgi:hypothetical protein